MRNRLAEAVVLVVLLLVGRNPVDAQRPSDASLSWSTLVGERIRLRGAARLGGSSLRSTLIGELQVARAATLVIAIDQTTDTATVIITPSLTVDRWKRVGGSRPSILDGLIFGGIAGGVIGNALHDETACDGFECIDEGMDAVFGGVLVGALGGISIAAVLAGAFGRKRWVAT